MAGGSEAVLAPAPLDRNEAAGMLEPFAGLLLLGGGDVDPAVYGQRRHPSCYGVDPVADRFELSLAGAAVALGLPVLAICRGMQVLNVALGGTLEQDISQPGHGDPLGQPRLHPVRLKPHSRTAGAMSSETIRGSSSHHQGVRDLGDGLSASGWTEDGLVEAVELDEGWVVGVQWHPERTAETDPGQRGLLGELVSRAGGS
jgi:putative glutamine amidotransferase